MSRGCTGARMGWSGNTRTVLESAIDRDRVLVIASLAMLSVLCWAWIVPMGRDMYGPMSGSSAWMMHTRGGVSHTALLAAMWAVMMTGMMLPSAAPALLLYARVARSDPNPPPAALRIY